MKLIKTPEESVYTKFIRIDGDYYIGDNGEWDHEAIEWNHQLSDRIDALRAENPVLLDAGVMDVIVRPNQHTVEFRGFSGKLHLPVDGFKEEARRRTVSLGEEKIFKGFDISGTLRF